MLPIISANICIEKRRRRWGLSRKIHVTVSGFVSSLSTRDSSATIRLFFTVVPTNVKGISQCTPEFQTLRAGRFKYLNLSCIYLTSI